MIGKKSVEGVDEIESDQDVKAQKELEKLTPIDPFENFISEKSLSRREDISYGNPTTELSYDDNSSSKIPYTSKKKPLPLLDFLWIGFSILLFLLISFLRLFAKP